MPCNRVPGTGGTVAGPFVNWAEIVTASPQQIFQPSTLDQLVAIVQQAEAGNLTVHAVGSGWSFTDVMTATGYMVNTDNLNGTPDAPISPPAGFSAPPLSYGSSAVTTPIVARKPVVTLGETLTGTAYPNDPVFGALTPTALQRKLCHVEAGIKVADLYTFLESVPSTVTTSDGFWHGYMVRTLGGSGGQAVTGVITTSTHGGDDHEPDLTPIRPLPDMVQGVRLVGAGGVEYFIQRAGSRAIVDPALLAQLDPCLASPGQIITDDDVLNAVVVAMGRMGIIYSLVLEVEPQYFLSETVVAGRWNQVVQTVNSQFRSDPKVRFLQILILPYGDYEQAQIGNNTTASTPFVVPDPNGGAWVYFQGTDNTLWKVRDDGSQQSQIGGNTTSSTPFVVPDPNGGAWVYFRGTDNTLWRVRDDGSQQSQIGGNTTSSTPFVVPDPSGGAWVYFQGTDNTLWKVRDDGSQQSQIGGNTTSSTPFVVPDPNGGAWVYFRGTDNTLWRVRDDGSQQSQIGSNTTASMPFVAPDPAGGAWVYFQGTDTSLTRGPGTLWRVRSEGDHTCMITTRQTVDASNFVVSNPTPNLGSQLFTVACEERPDALAAQIEIIIGGLGAFLAGSVLLGLIPIVGPLLAGLDIAAATLLIALLSPLLNPGTTIGDYLATAVNILDKLGLISLTKWLVNTILSSVGPHPGSREDVSFRIMDGYDYKGSCYKALSLEVGFNADDTAYQDYIAGVFQLIDGFASQNILTGGYISLRYCAGSEALLAIEQWPHTVCIEISVIAHLDGELQVMAAFENETAKHSGSDGRPPTVHWGQLNSRSRAQVEAAFPKIKTWRSALTRLSRKGNICTFDNNFCACHGLEAYGEPPSSASAVSSATSAHLAYLAPLLLRDV
jgi:hypothetical protein